MTVPMKRWRIIIFNFKHDMKIPQPWERKQKNNSSSWAKKSHRENKQFYFNMWQFIGKKYLIGRIK